MMNDDTVNEFRVIAVGLLGVAAAKIVHQPRVSLNCVLLTMNITV